MDPYSSPYVLRKNNFNIPFLNLKNETLRIWNCETLNPLNPDTAGDMGGGLPKAKSSKMGMGLPGGEIQA